ncbi:ABC-F family ATP-binding cassette domain-containing protein [Jeotgalibacillus sp. ET6]|uniref:ABC-F family ATP-binding cassette domain-containing protein n=1 Tax=Jeotgalibacillus sp. ET6 TaxID=3037260 RepID=UPI00241867C6|nr:ABC-F family ATP-binding cassette domain-containing protein [Jeotgalibacillus sp. ET6]MDG5473109.1 ABC-F family ATP-binding cassette domain-containing protein [Jeotgalibacillus sp. ET6]
MILLQVNGLSKAFGAEEILSNIKLEVQTKDRIALVGRNGAGKSTLLKMIAGSMSYDEGEIIKPKEVSLGYLEQHSGLESQLSIWEEMLSVFDHLKIMEVKLRETEQQMADPAVYENSERYERVMKEYDALQVAFKDQGGYQYEADIRSVLHGLRFGQMDHDTAISTLSGGQKTRLALGKMLLTKPDIMILDEPTNHLDIETLSWLEQYLQGYPGAILIVSHDRYFLDKVVNQVVELSRHRSRKYHGNYSYYLDQKALSYEREVKEFEKQQGEIAKLEDFIARNLVRASTTKQAQSRRKKLEKMDKMDRPQGDEKSASFAFSIDRQSGNDVLKLNDLTIGYDRPLSSHISTSITRQDSLALIGPNGVGKSTLLKTLVKKLEPHAGSIQYGSNVSIGYYDQEQAELNSRKTVLNELWDDYPMKNEKDIRTVLGNFLFSGEDVLKPVNALSGGEKARLALAKLMMQQSNLLILDEPTNHLDLDSKEILENALMDFPGTILFVSHDRYFINRIASKVLELSPEGATEFLGDYDYYLEKKLEKEEHEAYEREQAEAANPSLSPQKDKNSFQMDKEQKKKERQKRRRLEEIEIQITELESQIEENENILCDPDIFQDHEKVMECNEAIEQAKAVMDGLMEEWASLEEELEE